MCSKKSAEGVYNQAVAPFRDPIDIAYGKKDVQTALLDYADQSLVDPVRHTHEATNAIFGTDLPTDDLPGIKNVVAPDSGDDGEAPPAATTTAPSPEEVATLLAMRRNQTMGRGMRSSMLTGGTGVSGAAATKRKSLLGR